MADLREDALWSVTRCCSPLIGTAIHDGHLLRRELADRMALTPEERLREEDPFTAITIEDTANRVVVHRSRFEMDLNRPRDGAVYLRPEQAWGLEVWGALPTSDMVESVLRQHDSYYAMLLELLRGIAREHGCFVLLDMHSYNHRRDGVHAAPTAQEAAPDINIGTSSMDRAYWAPVVDAFMACLREQPFPGRRLDVRENIAFAGKGEQTTVRPCAFSVDGLRHRRRIQEDLHG